MDKDGTINRCEAELDVDGSVAVLDGVRREDLSRGEDIRLFTDQKSKNRSDESEKRKSSFSKDKILYFIRTYKDAPAQERLYFCGKIINGKNTRPFRACVFEA